MPVRKMSHKERDALFGAGLVLFGYSRPEKSKTFSPMRTQSITSTLATSCTPISKTISK
jgi:hypothetical protein